MNQALYAHMNNKRKMKKKIIGDLLMSESQNVTLRANAAIFWMRVL
jgi:hypothetical protein